MNMVSLIKHLLRAATTTTTDDRPPASNEGRRTFPELFRVYSNGSEWEREQEEDGEAEGKTASIAR